MSEVRGRRTVDEAKGSVFTYEQILWLDVPVYHMFFVQVVQRISHLSNILDLCQRYTSPDSKTHSTTSFLVESSKSRQLLVQLAFGRIFDDEEDPLRVVEVTVQS
jgi:hypothetical protein